MPPPSARISIRLPLQLSDQILLPPAAEDQVRVAVHEPGHDETIARVQNLRGFEVEFACLAHPGNKAVFHGHRTVADDAQVAERLAALGLVRRARQELGSVRDNQVRLHHGIVSPAASLGGHLILSSDQRDTIQAPFQCMSIAERNLRRAQGKTKEQLTTETQRHRGKHQAEK